MSLHNSELKIGVVHEIGCRLDDNLESTTKDMYRSEGASSALKQAVGVIENAYALVDKDVDDGKLDLDNAKKVKNYLEKTRNMMTSLAGNAETSKLTLAGKVQGLQQSITIAKKFKDDELNRVKALHAALAAGTVQNTETGLVHTGEGQRPTGVHPGLSIKERRRLEEQEASKATTEIAQSTISSTESKETEKPEETSIAAKVKTKKPKK